MDLHFVPDVEQEAFIRNAVESGRLLRAEDAMDEAMTLWEERERRRSEILAVIDRAEVSLGRGEGRTISSYEETKSLAEEVKRRGLARLHEEQSNIDWQVSSCTGGRS